MNREDIIRMAQEAGFYIQQDEIYSASTQSDQELTEWIERFAALVAFAEREACAALCFQMWEKWMDADPSERGNLPRDAEDCAHAIRARGQA